MTRIGKSLVVALLVAGWGGGPRSAHAQVPVIEIGPNLIQTTLNTLNNLQTMLTTIDDLINQHEQLTTQISALDRLILDGTAVSGAEWAQFRSQVATLAALVERGQAIAYQLPSVASAFESEFPGYTTPVSWISEYSHRTQSSLDTLAGVLDATGRNIGDASAVQDTLNILRSENESAVGQLSAIQTANRVASKQVEETVKLRQLVAAQTNAITVFYGQQIQKEAASEAAFQEFLHAPGTVRTYGSTGFSSLPTP